MLVWAAQSAIGGHFFFASGDRYAALASVSKNYSLAEVTTYLTSHGWTLTYSWEQGTPTRGQYAIDSWLASLPPDPTDNHRWIFAEANRTGADVTIGVTPPWPLTVYTISHVLHAVQGDAPSIPSTSGIASESKPNWTLVAFSAAAAFGVVFAFRAALKYAGQH